jgi:hypothetical protein
MLKNIFLIHITKLAGCSDLAHAETLPVLETFIWINPKPDGYIN